MIKLSVAIATYNEEKNIADCLQSVRNIADEIVIVDGSSKDKTIEIAKSFRAKVIVKDNPPNFHINKQKSFDLAKGEWVLYLDADERISKKLGEEIKRIIEMSDEEIAKYQDNLKDRELFLRHQQILEERDGTIGNDQAEYVAFFFPRLNYFLGKYLKYGGVYPDGVIRLFKKNMAFLPCKNVHEQMVVKGRVGWLQNPLLHVDSPNLKRYFTKNSRYIDLMAEEFKIKKVRKTPFQFINYLILKPFAWFFSTLIIHKGILDGIYGIIFSFFSALRFPRAYMKYISS